MYTLNEIFEFSRDGKLEKLCVSGFPNFLYECDREFDLGGKYFRPSGWDECFPTIDAYQTNPVMGDLVGQAPEINWQATFVEQLWRNTRFEARRRFSLDAPSCLDMSFEVTNIQKDPIEFLWASHALFSVTKLQKLRLENGPEYTRFDADNSVEKIFLANSGPVEFIYPNCKMLLTSDQPWWGIWLNRGGWPMENPNEICCLGVEATNTPGEYPAGRWLQTDTTFTGKVKLEIHSELFA